MCPALSPYGTDVRVSRTVSEKKPKGIFEHNSSASSVASYCKPLESSKLPESLRALPSSHGLQPSDAPPSTSTQQYSEAPQILRRLAHPRTHTPCTSPRPLRLPQKLLS